MILDVRSVLSLLIFAAWHTLALLRKPKEAATCFTLQADLAAERWKGFATLSQVLFEIFYLTGSFNISQDL
jgi:hypothetical protein